MPLLISRREASLLEEATTTTIDWMDFLAEERWRLTPAQREPFDNLGIRTDDTEILSHIRNLLSNARQMLATMRTRLRYNPLALGGRRFRTPPLTAACSHAMLLAIAVQTRALSDFETSRASRRASEALAVVKQRIDIHFLATGA